MGRHRYGNQGDTVDVGLAVLEPGTTRNHAYVALTRGRQRNHAWIPDPTGALDPADTLAGMITREADRGSALATHAHLHRAAATTDTATRRGVASEPHVTARDDSSNADSGRSLEDGLRLVQQRVDRLQSRGTGRSLHR